MSMLGDSSIEMLPPFMIATLSVKETNEILIEIDSCIKTDPPSLAKLDKKEDSDTSTLRACSMAKPPPPLAATFDTM
jgi:hypothetical protein